jgi:hypothetical protein
VLEPEIVNCGQLFRREHDLKALGAKVIHGRSRKVSKLSNLLNPRTWREFHRSPKKRQFSNIVNKNQWVMT